MSSTIRQRWRALGPRAQTVLLVLGSTGLALTMTALADLVTGPTDTLRGRRGTWLAALAVQPIGPVAYLLLGRRRPKR